MNQIKKSVSRKCDPFWISYDSLLYARIMEPLEGSDNLEEIELLLVSHEKKLTLKGVKRHNYLILFDLMK